MSRGLGKVLVLGAAMAMPLCFGEDLHLRMEYAGKSKSPLPPAVVWLTPLQPVDPIPAQHKTYTLLQKNRSFTPHLLVVPVGSQVQFPNADPFYHNVFSLFDGKRFDLGLYEAGSSKAVRFSREGVSYIFCNIHPEMSAVVVALSTPFFATAARSGQVETGGRLRAAYVGGRRAAGGSGPADAARARNAESGRTGYCDAAGYADASGDAPEQIRTTVRYEFKANLLSDLLFRGNSD
jgi:plastocyanin